MGRGGWRSKRKKEEHGGWRNEAESVRQETVRREEREERGRRDSEK